MENRQLNFDVARGGVQHRLSVCVGDTKSRTVTARFFSGSEPVPLTAAYLRGLRADGVQIYAACMVVDGAATYTFATSDLSVGGTLMCEFDLHNGDAVMTSPRFAVLCGNPLYTGEGAEGSDEYAAYIAALLKLENLTVTAETGDAAKATATVGDTAVQLHFVLPKGDKGDPGADGAPGAKGDKGEPGAKGDKGDKGDAGAPGVPGKDGENGLPGEKGEKGDAGTPGKDGAPGAKGDKGDTGAPGADGADGKDGADGHTPVITATKSGKVTTIKSDGEEIATVNDGKDGAPGKDGADGKPGEKGDKGDTGDPGSDYVLTDADKSEIAALVLAQIPDGDEVAYG